MLRNGLWRVLQRRQGWSPVFGGPGPGSADGKVGAKSPDAPRGRADTGGTMVARLDLQVEVVGCPTVCRHCWAQGVPYPAMPVDDVAWVLEQTRRFCDDHGLGFGAYPMHELAAHPQAAEVLGVFADHVGAAEFEAVSTTGVPLALRRGV